MLTEGDSEAPEQSELYKMKIRFVHVCAVLALVPLTVLLLTGCASKNTKLEKTLREEGIAFMQEGDYSAAVVRFDQAMSLHNGDYTDTEIDILRYRAEAEAMMGDYAAADDSYAELQRVDEDTPEYKNLRVICIVKSEGDLKEALRLYKAADAENIDSIGHKQALSLLGSALASSGNNEYLEEAKSLYQAAIDSEDPSAKSGELYNRMGTLSFREGDYDKAIEYFEEGVDYISGQDGSEDQDVQRSLLYNRAVCYEYKLDFKKALGLFEDYADKYGTDENLQHEIDFLKSRVH